MRGVAEGNCRALKDAVAYPDLAAQEGLVGSTPAPPHHYGWRFFMLKTIYESAWFLAICLFLILSGVAMVIFTSGIIRYVNICLIVTNCLSLFYFTRRYFT